MLNGKITIIIWSIKLCLLFWIADYGSKNKWRRRNYRSIFWIIICKSIFFHWKIVKNQRPYITFFSYLQRLLLFFLAPSLFCLVFCIFLPPLWFLWQCASVNERIDPSTLVENLIRHSLSHKLKTIALKCDIDANGKECQATTTWQTRRAIRVRNAYVHKREWDRNTEIILRLMTIPHMILFCPPVVFLYIHRNGFSLLSVSTDICLQHFTNTIWGYSLSVVPRRFLCSLLLSTCNANSRTRKKYEWKDGNV